MSTVKTSKKTLKARIFLLPAEIKEDELPDLPAAITNELESIEDEHEIKVQRYQLIQDDALELVVVAQAGDLANLYRFATKITAEVNDATLIDLHVAKEMLDTLPIVLRELNLMDYAFNQYKEDAEESKPAEIHLHLPEGENADALMDRQQKLADAIKFTRRIIDEPANVMTPQKLADEAKTMADEVGLECEVYDEKAIQEMGLEAYYSVAKGSDNPPRFIVLRHKGGDGETLALVGKGLCYDSGGYAIKSAGGMYTMHADMGGAGAVLGAMKFLAETDAAVNVTAIVAACENMLSGKSYKNGDIINSLSGKTIEVVNTDAEGRVTLADGITYAAQNEKADYIIDIATLTGAVVSALGGDMTGVMTDDERLWNSLEAAVATTGDAVWRLPVDEMFRDKVISKRADLANSVSGGAGTVTAGMFLREFALGTPWMHFDIAGTAYHTDKTDDHPMGASGVGVELLAEIALELL